MEEAFPHVPFPAAYSVFESATALGREIRELETFTRAPSPDYLRPSVARVETTPHGPLALLSPDDWDAGGIVLCDNGTGGISGIPASVWNFNVSGYRVLQKWLAGREGIIVDNAFLAELRDITGRINELIHRFDDADLVLQDALNHSLTRRELGLESPSPA